MTKRARQLYCHNGPKRRFEDAEQAEQALALIRSDPATAEREKTPTRIYRCPHCKGFHLTAEGGRRAAS